MSAAKTYSLRDFLMYQEMVDGRHRGNLDRVIAEYAAANRGVDLEQRLSFRQWFAQSAPKRASRSR